MARWFDDAAKRSAQHAPTSDFGVSRRTAIKRGAVVAGVAWTAPMLMQTRALAVGASTCAVGTTVCQGATTVACCGPNDTCNTTGGTPVCIPPEAPGGKCGNQGVGVCTSTTGVKSNCNGKLDQCNGCPKQYICGGEAAPCEVNGTVCAPGTVCVTSLSSTGKFCRKVCAANTDCNSGQVCDSSGYCAKDCSVNTTCQGHETCVSDGALKICNYDQK